jgi:hypothetical protein
MRKISGASGYRKWADWQTGDYFKGKLNSITQDQYKKNNYNMLVIETKFKDGKDIQKGTYLTLNSNGMLDKAMMNVNEGDTISLVFKGKSRIEKGPYAGKDSYSMDIFLEEETGSATATADASDASDDLLG